MAIEKILNTRISLKIDTFENWQKSDLILKNGEVAIATISAVQDGVVNKVPSVLLKVGDNAHKFSELNFVSALAADVHDYAKKSEAEFIAWIKEITAETYDAKGAAAAVEELLNAHIESYDAKVEEIEGSIADLEALIGELPEGDAKTIVEYVNAKTAGIATDAALGELQAAVDAIEADYLKDADKQELAGLVNTEKERAMGAESGLSGRLDAIEADYLTEADKYDDTQVKADIKANLDSIAAINAEETGILAQAKAYTDDELTFENGITTVNSLGGIGANVSLDGKSALEILDMLLFPYVKQTISNVKGSPNGGTYEKGNAQTITSVSATVTKKSKPITKVELLQGSEVLATKEGDSVKNGGTITFSGLSVAVNSTNVQLKVKAYDEAGSTVEGTTGAFTFVYPYYIGVCAEGATIDEALVEGLTKKVEAKGNKSHSFTTDYQCFVFAYPKAHGVLTSVLDPNNFEILGSFTRHEVSVTGLDGTAQTYYVYVNGASTVSGFTVNFKY